jgi:hypothetical protein
MRLLCRFNDPLAETHYPALPDYWRLAPIHPLFPNANDYPVFTHPAPGLAVRATPSGIYNFFARRMTMKPDSTSKVSEELTPTALRQFCKAATAVGLLDLSWMMNHACHKGNAALVKNLIDGGADIDGVDENGRPTAEPLCVAATHGQVEIVKLLLASGANPNVPDSLDCNESRPLCIAAWAGKLEVVKVLLEAGAGAAGVTKALSLTKKHEPRNHAEIEKLLTEYATKRQPLRPRPDNHGPR